MIENTMPRGRVALVFCPPYDADTKLVDLATGRHGYGHVAMWGGHFMDGVPLVLDSGIGYGVGFRPISIVCGGRLVRTTDLDVHLSAWIWRRALACIGSEYDYAGLMRKRRPCERYTCSGLVASCLPEHIRSELPGRVSPNDLARYFGVPSTR
jgi:hypothetical protein